MSKLPIQSKEDELVKRGIVLEMQDIKAGKTKTKSLKTTKKNYEL